MIILNKVFCDLCENEIPSSPDAARERDKNDEFDACSAECLYELETGFPGEEY
jgi:hypothetical protein